MAITARCPPSVLNNECRLSARKAQRFHGVGMPQSDPDTFGGLALPRQLPGIFDPAAGLLYAGVLAESSIHPDQGEEVQLHRCLAVGVPCGYQVRDSQPEAVAVGKAPGGVILEAGFHHEPLGTARAHAQEMLASSVDGIVGDTSQHAALFHHRPGVTGSREASVQPDLMSVLSERRQNTARSRAVQAIGGVPGQHGPERWVGADHEPGCADRMVCLELKQRVHSPSDRIPAQVAARRRGDPGEAVPVPLHGQLRHAQHREESPPIHH
ncbi:MAG: hypothetical protein K0S19_297, partial [Geminicoccaceae bacterium]|nr:hypothetical protein [Geminicoccaceae bacterium]